MTRLSKFECRRIVEEYHKGHTMSEVSGIFLRSIGTVYRVLHEAGEPTRPRGRKPGTPGVRTFATEDAARMRSEGLSYRKIASILGVAHHQTIQQRLKSDQSV